MDREYGDARYTSRKVEDRVAGFVGFDLWRSHHGHDACVARVLFWDACGQFSAETLGTDVPLQVLEEVIAEAKASIKTA
jgi:hypothetical protein